MDPRISTARTVGFVGAVTDHLDELVSPGGIAGLTIEEPVVAANREADKLKAAGRRHRRAAGPRGCHHHGAVIGHRPGVRLRRDRQRRGRQHRRDHLRPHPPGLQPLDPGAAMDRSGASRHQPTRRLGRSVRLQPQPAVVHRRPGSKRSARGAARTYCRWSATSPTTPATYTPNYPADPATAAIVATAVANSAVSRCCALSGEIDGPFNRAKLGQRHHREPRRRIDSRQPGRGSAAQSKPTNQRSSAVRRSPS